MNSLLFIVLTTTVALLNALEKITGIPKVVGVVITSLTVYSVFWWVFGPGLLCNLLGFLYPAYASFKAVESPDKDDDTQWLTYWVVYAFFNVLEAFSDVILFWMPFYYSLKFGILIWLFLPNTRGADVVYKIILQPLMAANQDRFDAAFNTGDDE